MQTNDRYGGIAEAHQILIAAAPPGSKAPTHTTIRRAAERGTVRAYKIGGRYAYHLGDVANLVTPYGGTR